MDHLCQEVTDSCCLTGTCIYGLARGIRCQLIQICGIRTAADDVDAVVGSACDLLQTAHRLSVGLRQAAIYHRCQFSHGLRYRLSRLLTVLFYSFHHIVRREEAWIVHIHSGGEVLAFLRHLAQLCKRVCVVIFVSYGLDHPQTHNIFQEAEPVIVTALIGEVGRCRLFGDNRCQRLNSHERPCSRTDVDAVP